MLNPQIEFWIAAILAAFLLGIAKGGLGIAGSLVVPVIALVMSPIEGAGLLLPLFILSDIYAIWLFRGSFSAVNLRILIPAGIVGILAGFLLISKITGDTAKLIVACVGLWYLIQTTFLRLSKLDRPPQSAGVVRGLFWGTLSGFTSYISHSGGPPFQAYLLPQKLPKLVFAGTSTLFFGIVNFLKLPPFIFAGQITYASIERVIFLIPVALVGARIGFWLVHIMPERVFYTMVELALLAVTLKLFWDVLF
jgi:uncharacterized protein